jgi:hypothetical protein
MNNARQQQPFQSNYTVLYDPNSSSFGFKNLLIRNKATGVVEYSSVHKKHFLSRGTTYIYRGLAKDGNCVATIEGLSDIQLHGAARGGIRLKGPSLFGKKTVFSSGPYDLHWDGSNKVKDQHKAVWLAFERIVFSMSQDGDLMMRYTDDAMKEMLVATFVTKRYQARVRSNNGATMGAAGASGGGGGGGC